MPKAQGTLPLPLPELVEEVAPLAIDAGLLVASEEQSPIFMIEGILSEFVPATKAQGAIEEKGLSSTFGKEDIEDKRIAIEGQTIRIASESRNSSS